jgi:hypothetical protein
MTLIRFVQRASILAGITFAGVVSHGSSTTAQAEKFCVVASNGKTACGTLKAIERACVTTDNGVVCGKFKSVAAEQGQEAAQPVSGNGPREVVNNITFSLKGCNRSDTTIKCVFSIINKGSAKYITISGSEASITDFSGKMYKGSSAEIGGNNSGKNTMQVTPEIDYEASITFENTPVGVKKAQVLSFPFQSKTVNLRNITISD